MNTVSCKEEKFNNYTPSGYFEIQISSILFKYHLGHLIKYDVHIKIADTKDRVF